MSFFPEFYKAFIDCSQAQPVPADWFLILVDVHDSTSAVAKGSYQDVNFLGASSISALRNAFPNNSVPFVFGGDGVLFLTPPNLKSELLELFCSVRDHAFIHLGLSLRVTSLPISDLATHGADFHYGFTKVGPREGFWFFRGRSFRLAEQVLKEQQAATPNSNVVSLPCLNGLSCRLNPFFSRQGQVVNLIISTDLNLIEEDRFYNDLFSRFLEERALSDFSPIHPSNLSRPWLSHSWEIESQLQKGKQKSLDLLIENIMGNFLLKLGISSPLTGKPSAYHEALIHQCDWIKMDGSLKMVLDLTSGNTEKLIQLLNEYEQSNTIKYGISFSTSATMVCQLDSGKDHRHLHFIDGSEGGLTRAATDLKNKFGAAGGT